MSAIARLLRGGGTAILSWVLAGSSVLGATRYVWLESPSPAPPYETWATAARTIQTAVDASEAGDTVLVTNGVYTAGGRASNDAITNRVAIDRAIRVASVNGPGVTVIEGAPAPGAVAVGAEAIRCVYVGSNAVLSGFTLTNGHAYSGGGAFSEISGVVTQCVLTMNTAGFGGGAVGGRLYDCSLVNNQAGGDGGGFARGELHSCTLTNNQAGGYGGGAIEATLRGCNVAGNSVPIGQGGGGAWMSDLYNCLVTSNTADYGGGVVECILYNCTLTGNTALTFETFAGGGGGADFSTLYNCKLTQNVAGTGGGASFSTLYNCLLDSNRAMSPIDEGGGGAYECTLYNCTVTRNSAHCAGGVFLGTLENCIVYFNTAVIESNYFLASFRYSCTAPLTDGIGNINADPRFVNLNGGDLRLGFGSPCIDAGTNLSALISVDLSGNPRPLDGNGDGTSDFDMGAYEFNPVSYVLFQEPAYVAGEEQGQVAVTVVLWVGPEGLSGPVTVEYAVGGGTATPYVDYQPVSGTLEFSIGQTESQIVVPILDDMLREGPESITLILSNPTGGASLGWPVTSVIQLEDDERLTLYVARSSPSPGPPYDSWATAAHTIQEAVDAALSGDRVLVTNGVYAVGGRVVHGTMMNRVAITRAVRVESVHGPDDTIIWGREASGGGNGEDAVRGVYVGSNAVLSGFTVTRGHTLASGDFEREASGGGVWCEESGLVTNCIISGNKARGWGGGARGGTFHRCILADNLAGGGAGGACFCILRDCVLNGNSADVGGGATVATLYHCFLTNNVSLSTDPLYGGGGVFNSTLYDCTLARNRAVFGGGCAYSHLFNSVLVSNTCNSTYPFASGGGAYESELLHCTVIGNAAPMGGGVWAGWVENSIVYFNTASNYSNHYDATVRYSCTTPLPSVPGDLANIVADPLILDPGGEDWRLSPESPCIDAGTNFSAGLSENFLTVDINGNPRPSDGDGDGVATVDMGAYEYPPAGYVLFELPAQSVVENESAASVAVIRRLNAGGLDRTATMDYATLGGTAVAGTDYASVSGTLTFAPGESRKEILVSLLNDGSTESDETILLSLNNPGSDVSTGNPATSIIRILDNDPGIAFAVDRVVVPESQSMVTLAVVRQADVNDFMVAVDFAVGSGTAVPAWDYVPVSGTLEFAAGQTNREIEVALLDDMVRDGSKTIQVGLSNSTGGLALATPAHVLIQLEDDERLTLHVWAVSPNPDPPYASWNGAAHTIQAAVDAAFPGDTVRVTNGVYASGGKSVYGDLINRVAIPNGVRVESVNGPATTLIRGAPAPGGGLGDGAVRGVYLGADSILSGFTVTDGHTRTFPADHVSEQRGGGIWCENPSAIVTNCVVSGNAASIGGGAYQGTFHRCRFTGNRAGLGAGSSLNTLHHCILTDNEAIQGGGVYQSTLHHCTVARNAANIAGGVLQSDLYSCIVYFNVAATNANHSGSTFRDSCTVPLPLAGLVNIAGDPQFQDLTGGDYRLGAGSPCIDTSAAPPIVDAADFNGTPRPLDGDGDGLAAFDMGAFEVLLPDADSNGDGIPDGWCWQHGLNPLDPDLAEANADEDKFTTYQEWMADTDPTDPNSAFRILSISHGPPVMIHFLSSSNRSYTLFDGTDAADLSSIVPGAVDVPGTGSMQVLSDNRSDGRRFYRIEARLPGSR